MKYTHCEENTSNCTAKPKKKLLWILGIGVLLLASAVTLLLCLGKSEAVDLIYPWGTSLEHVRENETVLMEGGGVLSCETDHNKVDNISEFGIYNNRVTYLFEEDTGELYLIIYQIDPKSQMSRAEQVDVLAKYYGDHYYKAENGFYYWWIGDTVIANITGEVSYYHESFFLNDIDDIHGVRAFFGK